VKGIAFEFPAPQHMLVSFDACQMHSRLRTAGPRSVPRTWWMRRSPGDPLFALSGGECAGSRVLYRGFGSVVLIMAERASPRGRYPHEA
jgi:hypothetical protein